MVTLKPVDLAEEAIALLSDGDAARGIRRFRAWADGLPVPDHIAIPEHERFYPAWDNTTFGPRTWRGPKT